jgi:thioredoxin-dependent peroxiredoxin
MINVGDNAPDFSLKGIDGKNHKLSDFKGTNVVLYFYPRDDTPGCTIEAKGFNKSFGILKGLNAEVIGISNDPVESHKKFCNKYSLGILLLSDVNNKVIKMYDAYGDKGIFGKGTLRKTYIIDKDGKITKIFGKVRPLGHNKEVIEALGGTV